MEKVTVPEGQRGAWRVERFTVSEQDAMLNNIRSMFGSRRSLPAGTYTRLMRGSTVVMSDTPAEMRDHWHAVWKARGNVLINGLGIGMVLHNILLKPDVTGVTVVELERDVIELVGPHYRTDPRVTIVHASAYEFKPAKGSRYGAVWHDIWDDICGDNLDGMKKLCRRFGRYADWQGCWARELCERGR